MQGLIEKVGLYAVENKSVSVDSIKDEFELENDDAKEIIGKLVTIGALEKSDTDNKYEAVMDRDAFKKRINSYRSITERIQAVSMSKNRNLRDITISKTLIKEESPLAVKTRVPGTWGENIRYVWIRKENIMEIHNGKTILTFLDAEKEYKLFDGSNRVVETVKGSTLYSKHYDSVEAAVRKRYEKMTADKTVSKIMEEQGRGRR